MKKHTGVWDWIDYGVKKGWCSQPVCDTHDGMPMSDEEYKEWDDGEDPCIPALRLYNEEIGHIVND